MSKPFLIIASVVAAAVVGYIVYMSYFTVETTVGKDVGVIGGEENTQPLIMPTTEEERLDALNSLASEGASASASESAKEEALNSAASSPKSDTIPSGESEKIKLLESLKRQ